MVEPRRGDDGAAFVKGCIEQLLNLVGGQFRLIAEGDGDDLAARSSLGEGQRPFRCRPELQVQRVVAAGQALRPHLHEVLHAQVDAARFVADAEPVRRAHERRSQVGGVVHVIKEHGGVFDARGATLIIADDCDGCAVEHFARDEHQAVAGLEEVPLRCCVHRQIPLHGDAVDGDVLAAGLEVEEMVVQAQRGAAGPELGIEPIVQQAFAGAVVVRTGDTGANAQGRLFDHLYRARRLMGCVSRTDDEAQVLRPGQVWVAQRGDPADRTLAGRAEGHADQTVIERGGIAFVGQADGMFECRHGVRGVADRHMVCAGLGCQEIDERPAHGTIWPVRQRPGRGGDGSTGGIGERQCGGIGHGAALQGHTDDNGHAA